MKKPFTLIFLLFCGLSVANAQSGSKKATVKSAPKAVAAPASSKPVEKAPAAAVKIQPRMILRDYIKMMSGDLEYMKNVVFLSEGFALDYNPVSEKTDEIIKMIASENDQRKVSDLIMNLLPKPVYFEGDFSKTASQYHSTLQLFFADHPSILVQLGENFSKAFEDEKAFQEHVFIAYQAGYYTKF